jgi:acetyl esterase/lipase
MRKVTRRGLALLGGAGALGLVAGPALGAGFDAEAYVNPELRPIFRNVRKAIGQNALNSQTLAARRGPGAAHPGPPPPGWTERMIPGAHGAPDVRIYVWSPGAPGQAPRPAILHIHGGGYVLGDARSGLFSLRDVTTAIDCVVVSVDYRLAPETRFPGSLEDNYAALTWLHANAAALGVDPARIAVMGESAGGGHAAMLAIAARDRGEVPLAYQALIYPMLDDRTGSTRKVPPWQGMIVWDAANNRFGWTSLLGVPAGSAKVPYGAVPARVADLRGLPPAFVGVGSIDLFVDEDIEYARRLVDAGTPVDLVVVPGAFHGFDMMPSPVAKRFRGALIAALQDALKPKA